MSAVGAALGPSPDPNPSRDQKFRGGRQRETAIQSALAAVTLQQKSCSPDGFWFRKISPKKPL